MSSWLNHLTLFIHDYLHIPPGYSTKLFLSLLVVLVYRFFSITIRAVIRHHIQENTKRYIAAKSVIYLLRLLLFGVLFNLWVGMGGELLAYFGLVSAGIALALKDPIANFAGWIFIMVGKPFSVGDRVQIADHMGDVIDIRTSQTSLLEVGNWVDSDQSSGRVIHIPNGWFLNKPLANYTQRFDFIWNEITVTVTFESDWKRAKTILTAILNENRYIEEHEAEKLIKNAQGDYLIFFKNLTPIVWTSASPSGVVFSLRYLCRPKQRRLSTHKIWEAILTSFGQERDIELAYPTQRFYSRQEDRQPPTLPLS